MRYAEHLRACYSTNLAVQVDCRGAEGLDFKFNLVHPDIGEGCVVEMSNATLTHISGYQAADADLTIEIDRADLEQLMLGKARLAQLAEAGKARLAGDPGVLHEP